MNCSNCTPKRPGQLIKVDKDGRCVDCGRPIAFPKSDTKTTNWDSYFLTICNAVASKSPCLSRQIGAILVRDHSIVSTGYNGPARGYPHCDSQLGCPRKLAGYKSGEGLVECPAAHAEGNCIANAARIGASTINSTLYMNTQIPCKDCMILLVNAGICEVVVTDLTPYHDMSLDIARFGNIKLRRFEL